MKKEWATPAIRKLSFTKTESGISGGSENVSYTGSSYKSGS